MFKIAICDDEIIFAKKIAKLIADYMEGKKIPYEVETYSSGKEFLQLGIEMMKYKIVFLDINMEEIDGLETARAIRKYSDDTFIVFVTAFINYALEGYKLDATRYLLKDKEMFEESIYECLDTIFDKMNYTVVKKEIRFNEGKREISLNSLLYIESNLHKLEFHVMEDSMQTYTIYDTLNHIEGEYSKYHFLRIHQSYMVNMMHLVSVTRYEAVLSNGRRLVVPRARYNYVKEAFIAYKGEF